MATQNDGNQLTRRQALLGGSMGLAVLWLTGCGSRQTTDSMPGPKWSGSTGVAPVTSSTPVRQPSPADLSLPSGVVPRSEWTRASPVRGVEINPMNGIGRITVHHDGLPPVGLRNFYDVSRRIEQIRQGHISRRPEPFADIGYHFAIDPSGRVWECRSVRYQGAHVKENNEHNLGVLVLGNFNEQKPTPQALGSLDRFVSQQMVRYGVPLSRVYTHQEIRSTECPGRSLQSYMVRTRSSGGALASAAASGRAIG